MTGTLWLEVVGMVLRYLAPALVGAVFHYMTETDQKRLIELLTSTEAQLTILAALTSLAFGARAWWKKTRVALTAAATDGVMTMAEATDLAKTQAPRLSTQPTDIPQLTPNTKG